MGCIRVNRNGRINILCVRDLDKQFIYLIGLTLVLSVAVLIFALAA